MTTSQDKTDPSLANYIRLIGRVREPMETRVLADGAEVLSFSMVVARPAESGTARGQSSDIIDISCRSARSRQMAAKLSAEAVIEVEGALHHRFWQAGGRTASRYEVDVSRIVRKRAE